jgi:TatD DNase family protein
LALGIHPESLEDNQPGAVDECLQFVRENIKEAVAVGEIGLDYWYKWARKNDDKKKEQRDVFARQLDLAKEFDLPVIIHSRGSWRDCLDMTKAAQIKKANFHWYSGPLDILDEIVACGYFISASPALAYSPQHQDAVRHVPIEHLLIETDSPVFYENFSATPKDVLRTLKLYSSMKDIEEAQAAKIFFKNTTDFFCLSL